MKELSGWKQISSYLDVSEPTARRFFKELGLPAYQRGRRYYAYSDELDAWKRGNTPTQQLASATEALPEARKLERRWIPLVLSLLGLGLTGVFFFLTLEPPEGVRSPSSLALESGVLKAMDTDGVVWERFFPDRHTSIDNYPLGFVEDVDGDGRGEVFFNYVSKDPSSETGRLICFDDDGAVLWEFSYGAELTVGERYFEPIYRGKHLRYLETPAGEFVLVVAFQAIWYPAQVTLLDPASGELVSEYWHPGYINSTALFDLDRDGAEEILLGGMNNPGKGYGNAFLAALKIPFEDRKPDQEESFLKAGSPGEVTYRLFPRTDVDDALAMGSYTASIHVQGPDRIMLLVGNASPHFLLYYLNGALEVVDVRPSDLFIREHDRLHREGLLNHPYTNSEVPRWKHVLTFNTAPDANSEEVQALFPGPSKAAQ